MQNTFGTLVAVGIVTGGFLLTGDLGWCVRRVSHALDRSAATAAGQPAVAAPESVGAPAAAGSAASADGVAAARPAAPGPAPRLQPTAGLDPVDLTKAPPGQRIVVWTATRGREPDCHVIHVLDASSGEALLQRRGRDGDGPARRVAISTSFAGGDDDGMLRVNGSLLVRPLGLAPGLGGIVETRGPISGLAVE